MSRTFEIEQPTLDAIRDLMPHFGARTSAQVLTKTLALARVAAQNAHREGDDWVIRVVRPNGEVVRVLLNG